MGRLMMTCGPGSAIRPMEPMRGCICVTVSFEMLLPMQEMVQPVCRAGEYILKCLMAVANSQCISDLEQLQQHLHISFITYYY